MHSKDLSSNSSNQSDVPCALALNNMDKNDASVQERSKNACSEDLNFTFRIYKECKIRIYKPLIPLKVALFCWGGAGAIIHPFLSLYFKQRGLTLSELSTIYMISPVVQFLGPTLSGVIADKLGRSKPVLVTNLLITVFLVIGMLLVPTMKITSCDPQESHLKCHGQHFMRLYANAACNITDDIIKGHSCHIDCPENVTAYCDGNYLICESLAGNKNFSNFSISIHVSDSFQVKDLCFYNVHSMSHKNITYSWCKVPDLRHCNISCIIRKTNSEDCEEETSFRYTLLVINILLLIVYFTTLSNCYRFMDVTAMALVKEHDSDFGRERIFSITGILVMSPIAGLLVNSTTSEGGDRNYAAAFYLFIGMVLLTILVTFKLKVQINSPGKNMWRKSITLLKNPDIAAFVLVLFVLGTTWGFVKNFLFWYLEEELSAPSVLLGLVPAIGSLYGLPFLFTSRWWIKKVGSTQIFVLGLLGYVGSGLGYSFLYDPWLSLLLEVTNILTYHLLWVAVIVYSHDFAPEGLVATVISTAGGIHFSVGKSSGSLVGGVVMDAFGGRIAYRVMAIICLISAVLYSFYLYLRRTCFTRKAI